MTDDRYEVARRPRLSRSVALLATSSLLPTSIGSGPNLNVQWMLCIVALCAVFLLTDLDRAEYRRGGVVIVVGFAVAGIAATIAGLFSVHNIASPTSLITFAVALVAVLALITSRPPTRQTTTPFPDSPSPQIQWILWPLVALGLLQTLGIPVAWKFTELFYNASYSELLSYMRLGGEPVTVFATHSVAAAAYAVLVLIALSALSDPVLSFRQRLSLRLAIAGLMLLLLRLLGSTSLVLTLLTGGAIVVVAVLRATAGRPGLRARWALTMVVGGIGLFGLGTVLFIRLQSSTPWGGVAARANAGAPFAVVPTMGDRLVLGTGFFETTTYSYADSGILETLVRFGVLGVGLLVMLYLFFVLDVRRVLAGTRFEVERWSLMVAIAVLGTFEIGYEVLTSPRLLALLLATSQFAGELGRSRHRLDAGEIPARTVSAAHR